tara:strand:- start:16351 stop:17037 length:687 start_codon:yes stop_codon:yes gene_type:complete
VTALNQNTRQRIIGTVVLAVAAIVLLPAIFDGEGSYQAPLQTQIPETPQRPEPARTMPERPVITADSDAIRIRPETQSDPASTNADQTDPALTDTEATTVSANDDSPQAEVAVSPVSSSEPPSSAPVTAAASDSRDVTAALDPRGLPEAWSVRLGSFSSQTNATNLVARLQGDGHRAYTRRLDSSQGPLTAVFVGPLVDRAAAQTLLEQLRQNYQLSGLVVRYQIEEL